jgi:hypothetical protein
MNVRFLLDHDVTDGHLKNRSAHAQKIEVEKSKLCGPIKIIPFGLPPLTSSASFRTSLVFLTHRCCARLYYSPLMESGTTESPLEGSQVVQVWHLQEIESITKQKCFHVPQLSSCGCRPPHDGRDGPDNGSDPSIVHGSRF